MHEKEDMKVIKRDHKLKLFVCIIFKQLNKQIKIILQLFVQNISSMRSN